MVVPKDGDQVWVDSGDFKYPGVVDGIQDVETDGTRIYRVNVQDGVVNYPVPAYAEDITGRNTDTSLRVVNPPR